MKYKVFQCCSNITAVNIASYSSTVNRIVCTLFWRSIRPRIPSPFLTQCPLSLLPPVQLMHWIKPQAPPAKQKRPSNNSILYNLSEKMHPGASTYFWNHRYSNLWPQDLLHLLLLKLASMSTGFVQRGTNISLLYTLESTGGGHFFCHLLATVNTILWNDSSVILQYFMQGAACHLPDFYSHPPESSSLHKVTLCFVTLVSQTPRLGSVINWTNTHP